MNGIDNNHFVLSEIMDGLLIDRISKSESGLYLCMGIVPLPKRLITSFYPIMVFVSDPSCKNILAQLIFYYLFLLFWCFFLEEKRRRKQEVITRSCRQITI